MALTLSPTLSRKLERETLRFSPAKRPPMTPRSPSPGLKLAIDYGPLLAFMAVNFLMPGALAMRIVAASSGMLSGIDRLGALVIAKVVLATAAFMAATVAAMIVSRLKLGAISPMLWISGGLVVVFGALTVYLHDPRFIQMKPTAVYALFAVVLGVGLATGRPLLEQLLGSAYPGLSQAGWRRLTVNWAVFFAALAILNEIARAVLTFDHWVLFKFPGCAVLTAGFALANIPMLLRHGLMLEDGAAAEQLPPE